MSKELNKAPAEQAGGDERDLQGAQGERDGWGPFPIVQVPWNVFDRAVMWVEDRRRYGDDGTIVDDWKALKTIQRAALAQPSPKCATCNGSGFVDDGEINFYPDGTPFENGPVKCVKDCPDCAQPTPAQAEAERPEVAEVAFVLRSIGAMDAEDIDGDNVDLRFEDAEGRDTGCDASIVEYAEKAADLLEQQDRIVGALRYKAELYDEVWALVTGKGYMNVTTAISVLESERDAALAEVNRLRESKGDPSGSFDRCMRMMYERDENAKRLDAALAKIAELEAKLSDPTAVHQWQFSNAWFDGSEEVVLKAGKEGSPIRTLYAAPVAQAQHSAPDVCDGKEQDAFEEWARKEGLDTSCHPMHWLFLDAKTNSARQGWKAALRYVRAHIAAPSQAQHSVPIAHEFKRALGLVVAALEADGDRPTSKYALSELKKVLAAAPGTEVPQAWLDVQAERRRQITAEGWTPDHDDLYCAAELPRAAAAYILSGANDEAPAIWPFSAKWWKPRDARANYMRAGALILAEIERLDRAAERGKEVGHE